jgi:hypothetical protein
MARISKEDHPKILRMVEVEHRKMTEIAAEYGCTPANISALVGKLRRRAAEGQQESARVQSALALDQAQAAGGAPVDAESPQPEPAAPDDANINVVAFERTSPAAAPRAPLANAAATPSEPAGPAGSGRRSAGTAAIGAKLAKPGFGLVMRSADGDESMTPFRSLDDLLSAIKPILRAGARSPEPVWFSLQPVDLATMEIDAA